MLSENIVANLLFSVAALTKTQMEAFKVKLNLGFPVKLWQLAADGLWPGASGRQLTVGGWWPRCGG